MHPAALTPYVHVLDQSLLDWLSTETRSELLTLINALNAEDLITMKNAGLAPIVST